jgi:hypothetical protein
MIIKIHVLNMNSNIVYLFDNIMVVGKVAFFFVTRAQSDDY